MSFHLNKRPLIGAVILASIGIGLIEWLAGTIIVWLPHIIKVSSPNVVFSDMLKQNVLDPYYDKGVHIFLSNSQSQQKLLYYCLQQKV